MKFLSTFIFISLMTASSFASIEDRYNAQVGAETIARSVVDKKLVNAKARKVIKLALETGKAELGKMTCEAALGSRLCSIDVSIKDDPTTSDAEETLYRLEVKIFQGTVKFASWEMVAG